MRKICVLLAMWLMVSAATCEKMQENPNPALNDLENQPTNEPIPYYDEPSDDEAEEDTVTNPEY